MSQLASYSVVDQASAEHYTWGATCDGWHLLKHPDLSIIQERVPPGGGEARHVHSRARQFFYVLSGSATLELDGAILSFSSGQGVHVAPGLAHKLVNHSREDLIFLVISAPTTSGDRIDV